MSVLTCCTILLGFKAFHRQNPTLTSALPQEPNLPTPFLPQTETRSVVTTAEVKSSVNQQHLYEPRYLPQTTFQLLDFINLLQEIEYKYRPSKQRVVMWYFCKSLTSSPILPRTPFLHTLGYLSPLPKRPSTLNHYLSAQLSHSSLPISVLNYSTLHCLMAHVYPLPPLLQIKLWMQVLHKVCYQALRFQPIKRM